MDERAARGEKVIRVQNIYHMLAHTFQVLHEQDYSDVATENFDNAAKLIATILARSVPRSSNGSWDGCAPKRSPPRASAST